MFKRLYVRVDALCKARPKTMWGGMVIFTTTAFLVNPGVWKYPEFTAWIAAAVLLPAPFQVWAMVRRNRAKGAACKPPS